MAAVAHLTEKLLASVRFDRQMVPGKKGALVATDTPPGTREWVIRDDELEGFHVRVTPGVIGWYVRRRMGERGDVRRAMGDYPSLSAADARKRARVWLSMMSEGLDPLREKKVRQRAAREAADRENRTMAAVFADYTAGKKAKAKASTTTDRAKVPKWMQGAPLWHRSIFDITADDVEATLGPLRDVVADGAKRPGWGPKSISPGTLRKLYAYLSAAWKREAAKHGLSPDPFKTWMTDQRLPKQMSRTTMLPVGTDAGNAWLRGLVELRDRAHDPAILTTRPDPRGEGLKPHVSVLTDWFLCVLLWGARKEEVARLKWEDVDFDGRLVVFPDTKSGRAGVVPLTPWAADILHARHAANARWRPEGTGPWVFPSRQHGKPLNNPRSVMLTLQNLTGLKITPHDLRRTLATQLRHADVAINDVARMLLVSAALNHSRGATGGRVGGATAGYVQHEVEALRPAFQARENELRRIVGLPVLAAAETKDAALADGTIEDLLEKVKSDPALKQKLLESLLK